MRTLLTLLLVLFLTSTARSQIYAVSFKEAKDARKYKNHLVLINGEQVVVGESKYAIYIEGDSIKYAAQERLWVALRRSNFVPYARKKNAALQPQGRAGDSRGDQEHPRPDPQ
jgi:hypothetical protein